MKKIEKKKNVKLKNQILKIHSQNKVSLTKILKEGSLKAMIESECINEELTNNNFNEDDTFDMIQYDATVTPSSKFILSLTDPDFTAYKVLDVATNTIYLRKTRFSNLDHID